MLVVFFNNKLISCDTLTPFLYELHQNAPEKTIEMYCFDQRTFTQIHENTVLSSTLKKVGRLRLFTDHKRVVRHQTKLQRMFFRLQASYLLLRLVTLILFRRVKILHFKALNDWPLRLLFELNRKNTYLCESTTAGVTETERASDMIIKQRQVSSKKPAAGCLLAFSHQWGVLRDPRLSDIPRYILEPPYQRALWQKYLTDIADDNLGGIIDREGKGCIVYVLSSMDNEGCLEQDTNFLNLFRETLQVFRLHTPNATIVIKRHPATRPDYFEQQNIVLNEFQDLNIEITVVHPQLLARIADVFIANFYSSTFDAARSQNVPTIEYTAYPQDILNVTHGKSTRPDMTSQFIQRDTNRLAYALRGYIEAGRKKEASYSFERSDCGDYDAVLSELLERPLSQRQQ